MVTAQKTDSSHITRNASHFRPLPPSFQPAVDPDVHDKDDNENLEYALLPDFNSDAVPASAAAALPPATPPPVPVNVRRSGRVTKTSAYLDDYITK